MRHRDLGYASGEWRADGCLVSLEKRHPLRRFTRGLSRPMAKQEVGGGPSDGGGAFHQRHRQVDADAVTGQPLGDPLTGHTGNVT